MEGASQISQFGAVLLFIIGGIIFTVGGVILSRLLAPNRPNPEKLSTYECGEDPVGNARIQINMRFYVAALIFLIFDVEIIFFSLVHGFADKELIAQAPAWGWFSLVEIFIFTGILLIGLAYVWVKGDLDWVRPNPIPAPKVTNIPAEVYAEFNKTHA